VKNGPNNPSRWRQIAWIIHGGNWPDEKNRFNREKTGKKKFKLLMEKRNLKTLKWLVVSRHVRSGPLSAFTKEARISWSYLTERIENFEMKNNKNKTNKWNHCT
jgi:hypothetical protein